MNVAPDAASIAVTRLLARSEDAVIRPFVEQVSREPRLRDPETNTYGGLYLWADQEAYRPKVHSSSLARIGAEPHPSGLRAMRAFRRQESLDKYNRPR